MFSEIFVYVSSRGSSSRDVHDVVHKVASVGSRSVEKAQEFIDRVAGGDKSIKGFGSYEEVYADKARCSRVLSHRI